MPEWIWIVFVILFIVWMMKLYFNEKEIKEKGERIKKLEYEKRIAKVEAELMETEGKIKDLENENNLLRIRIRELED